jgi:hypothetical protein
MIITVFAISSLHRYNLYFPNSNRLEAKYKSYNENYIICEFKTKEIFNIPENILRYKTKITISIVINVVFMIFAVLLVINNFLIIAAIIMFINEIIILIMQKSSVYAFLMTFKPILLIFKGYKKEK